MQSEHFSSSSKAMESLWISSSPSALQGFVLSDEDLNGWWRQQLAGKKRRLTATQVEFLERSFEFENKLDSERKLQVAKQLGLSPRQVAIWFQNRRARSKNKQLEKDYDSLRASFNKLKADFDNLLKEKDGLQNEVTILKEKLLIRQEEACSAKSDVFESDSPRFADGNGYRSLFMDPKDQSFWSSLY